MSGKSGRYSLIILLLLGLAGQAMAINIMLYPSGGGEKNGGFDSEQPDTLRYDDGGYFYLFGIETDLWGIVRFTAPADFELRCCYLQMLNPNGVSNGVEVTVYDDNGFGEPGDILSGPYSFEGPLWIGSQWLDVEMDQPYPQIAAGEEFFVIFGPAPTGQVNQGWFLYFDHNGNTESRSGYGLSSSGPWTYDLSGDLVVRAGGLADSYVDLAVLNCYNEAKQFFIDAAESVIYGAEVVNLGNAEALDIKVIWSVQDSVGTQVFADSVSFNRLQAGGVIYVDCPGAWISGPPGNFTVAASAYDANDLVTVNNTAMLEQGIGPAGYGWYRYDDGEADANIFSSPGIGWGNRFDPPEYPVQVTSVQIEINGIVSNSDVRLVNFTDMGIVELWDYNGFLLNGLNTFNLTGEGIHVFEGGIGVGYVYQGGESVFRDEDPPLAADNDQMPAVAYYISGEDWTPFEVGDWMLRVYCVASSAVPPYPLIRLEPDTLNFGTVQVSDPVILSFWVCNDGTDNLIVTDITVDPAIVDELFVFNTSFTVVPSDSEEVPVIWIPDEAGPMGGNLSISNNATGASPEVLYVFGTATALGIPSPAEFLPQGFHLIRNFPNPFNNFTEFELFLPNSDNISLKIYDLSGREAASVVSGQYNEGFHLFAFDGSKLASGVYIYRLELSGSGTTKGKLTPTTMSGKMVLMK